MVEDVLTETLTFELLPYVVGGNERALMVIARHAAVAAHEVFVEHVENTGGSLSLEQKYEQMHTLLRRASNIMATITYHSSPTASAAWTEAQTRWLADFAAFDSEKKGGS